MDDLQLVLEESKTAHNAACYSSEYVFGHASTLKLIQRTSIHEFHAVIDARLDEEGSVEFDDFWSYRAMKNVQFHYNGVQFALIKFETDFLEEGGVRMCKKLYLEYLLSSP